MSNATAEETQAGARQWRARQRALWFLWKTPIIVWNDLRLGKWGQRWPRKPATLNLLINDICNSKCQMCHIWQQKRDHEITADELQRVLSDPLFSELTYIGISGGEPTLRKDLPEIVRVIAQKQPRLRGAGIITNAIRAEDVIARVEASAEICARAGLAFNIMVSLDGVGEIHDRIRGRAGNFESALKVIRHFQNRKDIPLLFGCTITKDNVWHVEELLDFALAEGLYGRFRIAEFIQRLYNADQTKYIRNFSPLEAYHLGLFFQKLEYTFEPHPIYQQTYRNIRQMLMQEAPRTIACPYQTHAAVLDSRGQLLYCSPKSRVLGNTLDNSAKNIYLSNISERKRIMAEDCNSCIHDYHTLPNTRALIDEAKYYYWQAANRVKPALIWARRPMPGAGAGRRRTNPKHALIVGWYGTETAGDKAILGEILHQLHQRDFTRITLASIYPYLSQWTLQELDEHTVEIISTYSRALLKRAREADETIMGGGPFMDIHGLGFVLRAFDAAKRAGRRTRVAGCGIGPLHAAQNIAAVKHILQLADVIELRDDKSVEWAVAQTGRSDISNSGDPAVAFVQRWRKTRPHTIQRAATLNCYLRDWSVEYQGDLSDAAFRSRKAQFQEEIASWIAALCRQNGLRPRLLAMHHFVVGGDDREFNHRLASNYLADLDPILENHPYSVQQILTSMQEGAFCLTMRFHATLFAATLGAPYIAIDYTDGGKITRFMQERDEINRLITLSDVVNGHWRTRFSLNLSW